MSYYNSYNLFTLLRRPSGSSFPGGRTSSHWRSAIAQSTTAGKYPPFPHRPANSPLLVRSCPLFKIGKDISMCGHGPCWRTVVLQMECAGVKRNVVYMNVCMHCTTRRFTYLPEGQITTLRKKKRYGAADCYNECSLTLHMYVGTKTYNNVSMLRL